MLHTGRCHGRYTPPSGYADIITPLKTDLDNRTDAVNGTAAVHLEAYPPESPLSNWAADALRNAATDFIGCPADIGVVNMGGLRTDIPEGDITLRRMYELMPFDNKLSVVWLRGTDLDSLCQCFARNGGQGISGMQFHIRNGRASDIRIAGCPLQADKEYTVCTNDYLVAGNDDMMPLTRHTRRRDTDRTVRDAFIQAVEAATAQGQAIRAAVEGRITINE